MYYNIAQKTIDLPISSGDPAEIDTSGVDIIWLAVAGECYITLADNSTLGATRIASDDTRQKIYGAGAFEIHLNKSQKLYIRSSGAAITDGVSYSLGVQK